MKKRLPTNLEKFRYSEPALYELYGPQVRGRVDGVYQIPYAGVTLRVICGCGEGWDHVSVSLPDRCPTWDEMNWVKNLFFEPDETAIQFHPPHNEYINVCKTVLHMWRSWNQKIELPPQWMLV